MMNWNRNYRILWSEARRAWVVADERAGTRGKGKSRGVAGALACAMLVAGGMLAAAPEASALSGVCGTVSPVTVSSALTGACTATATDSITVTNTGSITAAPNAKTIVVDLNATGVRIDNAGQLKSQAVPAIEVQSAVFAGGRFVPGATGVTIVNQAGGLISATKASAIVFTGGMDAASSITNHGVIKAIASNGGFATGINVYDASGTGIAGAITNSGSITALAQTSGSRPVVTGVNLNGVFSGALTNSGSVTATAIMTTRSTSTASATGISVNQLSGSLTITNTGTVKASASALAGSAASANGVLVTSLLAGGALTNHGVIQATGKAAVGSAQPHGINVGNQLAGTITNAGTISAKATGASEYAHGISVVTMASTGVLKNTGTISATASNPANAGRAYSLSIGGTGGAITNSSGGVLRGSLNIFSGATVTNKGTIDIPDGAGGSITTPLNNQGGVLQIGNLGTLTTPNVRNSGAVSVAVNSKICCKFPQG